MKYSNGRGIKTSKWVSNEVLRNEDINFINQSTYMNYTDLLATLVQNTDKAVVVKGLQLNWDTAMSCNLIAGMCISFAGDYFTDVTWGFTANSGNSFIVVLPVDVAIAFDVGGTLDRIDVLEVRPTQQSYNAETRKFKDPVTKLVTSAIINTRLEYGYEYQVLKGVENVSPMATASTAGWIKLAEVYVAGSASAITQNDIKDVRDSDTWVTESLNTMLMANSVNKNISALTASPSGSYSSISAVAGDDFLTLVMAVADKLRTGDGIQDNAILDRHLPDIPKFTAIYIDDNKFGLSDYSYMKQLGSSFTLPASDAQDITALDSTHIAFIDNTVHQLTTYIWNGNVWAKEGAGLDIGAVSWAVVSALDSNHVAVLDAGVDVLSEYYWDGSIWVLEGSSLSIPGIASPLMEAMDATHVVIQDLAIDELRRYSWNGSIWALDGTGLSLVTNGNGSICMLDSNHIALGSSTTNDITCYYWNGSIWAKVGASFDVVSADNMYLAKIADNKLLFANSIGSIMQIYNWDGAVFSQEGDDISGIISTGPSMCFLDSYTLAYTDMTNDKLETHKFAYSLVTIS